jgi:nitrogen regulatory protein PII
MKKVEAIIRPHLLDAVRTALQEVDVIRMALAKCGLDNNADAATYRG